MLFFFFFFNDTATTEIYTLSLHDALPILFNREVACDFAGGMLSRGSKKHTRAQLKDAFDKLNATVSVGGEGASIEVRKENLAGALRLEIGRASCRERV